MSTKHHKISRAITNLKLVPLQQIIEIDAQKLKRDTDMASKCEVVVHGHNVVTTLAILLPKCVQD